ncbi:MAG: PD-(D/E)XK nuclease family protein [Acidimicrobiia bacterium]
MAHVSITTCGYGPDLLDAVSSRIAEVQQFDRLAPVTVVAPTNLASLAMRRQLGSRPGGLLNVRFLVLARVAELLISAAPSSGRRAAASHEVLEAVRLVLGERQAFFGEVAQHSATVRAVVDAIGQLDDLDPDERNQALTDSVAARELAEIARQVGVVLGGRRLPTQLLGDAAECVAADPHLAQDLGHIIVAAPLTIGHAAAQLLRALAGADRLSIVLALTGDERVDGHLLLPVSRFAAPGSIPPRLTLSPVDARGHAPTVVIAPDAHTEVAEAVRTVHAAAAEGTALHRIAICVAEPGVYLPLVHHELSRAGLPVAGPSGHVVAQSAAGRLLLGRLALDPRLEREAVLAWLSSTPMIDGSGNPVPAERWRRLARRAGVVRGLQQWRQRVVRFAAIMAERQPELSSEASRLAEFVVDIDRSRPARFPQSWSERGAWCRSVIERFLPHDVDRAAWPEAEVEAARVVDAVIDELAGLDAFGVPIDVDTFAEALRAGLQQKMRRLGALGSGVVVGPMADAVHLDVDLLIIVGCREGALPASVIDRGLTGAVHNARRQQRQAQARALQARVHAAAVGGAGRVVLTFSRAEPSRARPAWPSAWVVDALSDQAGTRLTAEAVLAGRDSAGRPLPGLRQVVSRRAQIADITLAPCRDDLDLGLRHIGGHLSDGDAASSKIAAELARVRGVAGEHTGVLSAGRRVPGRDRAASPTALEHWATCPRRWLYSAELGLNDDDEPTETEAIDPRDAGSLVHEALETFIGRHLEVDPDHRWTDEELAEADAIVAETAERFEAMGRTGSGLGWEVARQRLSSDVRQTLLRDNEHRSQEQLTPVSVEMRFGIDNATAVLDLDGSEPIAFKGVIDRVDRSRDGRTLMVTDYKTGRAMSQKDIDAGLANGSKLQLPIYALAASQAWPDAQHIRSRYWYTSRGGDWKVRSIEFDDAARHRLGKVVSRIADGIESGLFPANPGPGDEHCGTCPFDRICPADRGDQWVRLSTAPELASYAALISALDPGDDSSAGDASVGEARAVGASAGEASEAADV